MFADLLPDTVRTAIRSSDDAPQLFQVEREAITGAVAKRRSEFASGRACAREALAELGVPEQPIPVGPRGEPVWPPGVVGSITHCKGLRACAVAQAAEVLSVGIDAEVNEPLPPGVSLSDIAVPAEAVDAATGWQNLGDRTVHWDRLLFCMKEAVYKTWFPLTGRWLGFHDARIVIKARERSFEATLLVEGPSVDGRALRTFQGRWLATDRFLLTAIALVHARSGAR